VECESNKLSYAKISTSNKKNLEHTEMILLYDPTVARKKT
jgi:hypothetical protein